MKIGHQVLQLAHARHVLPFEGFGAQDGHCEGYLGKRLLPLLCRDDDLFEGSSFGLDCLRAQPEDERAQRQTDRLLTPESPWLKTRRAMPACVRAGTIGLLEITKLLIFVEVCSLGPVAALRNQVAH